MIIVKEIEAVGKGRYRVQFDTGVTCLLYRKEMSSFSIEKGKKITAQQYQELLEEVVGKRAKKRALHLLEQMDRTEKQLRDKLLANEYPQSCIDGAIAYVKGFHYLDDSRYASNYVRFSQEKMSRVQMKQKLMQKGIASSVIADAIEEGYVADEMEQIMALLQKRKFVPEEADEKEFQRTYQYVMRRGFKSSDILKVPVFCISPMAFFSASR